jgi:hypothetical protein
MAFEIENRVREHLGIALRAVPAASAADGE